MKKLLHLSWICLLVLGFCYSLIALTEEEAEQKYDEAHQAFHQVENQETLPETSGTMRAKRKVG